jgi:hypothetical protein
MCDDMDTREQSRKTFLEAKTMVDFMKLWSSFYENKICIPTYFASFIGGEDNEQATHELGLKFKEITRRGFLAVDSQLTIPGNQKGYIVGYLPNKMAELVTTELNRYSGIIAFSSDLKDYRKDNIDVAENFYITYDAIDETIVESAKIGKMLGEPFTNVGSVDLYPFELIREWMSKPLQKKFIPNKYKYITIVAPCFDSPAEYIFDKLLEVLRNI